MITAGQSKTILSTLQQPAPTRLTCIEIVIVYILFFFRKKLFGILYVSIVTDMTIFPNIVGTRERNVTAVAR